MLFQKHTKTHSDTKNDLIYSTENSHTGALRSLEVSCFGFRVLQIQASWFNFTGYYVKSLTRSNGPDWRQTSDCISILYLVCLLVVAIFSLIKGKLNSIKFLIWSIWLLSRYNKQLFTDSTPFLGTCRNPHRQTLLLEY